MSLDPEHFAACSGVAGLPSNAYVLSIKQEPSDCKAIPKQEKVRGGKWPLDPPPVIELTVGGPTNDNYAWMASPFWFCSVEIDVVHQKGDKSPEGKLLVGTTVSSLHRVKHTEPGLGLREKAYFIFGDLNIRDPGVYRLKFLLYEMRQGTDGLYAEQLGNAVHTKQFEVFSPKHTLTLRESTALSKALCESGVKLRIRKEVSKRRKTSHVDWAATGRADYRNPHSNPGVRAGATYVQTAPISTMRGEDISGRIQYTNDFNFNSGQPEYDGSFRAPPQHMPPISRAQQMPPMSEMQHMPPMSEMQQLHQMPPMSEVRQMQQMPPMPPMSQPQQLPRMPQTTGVYFAPYTTAALMMTPSTTGPFPTAPITPSPEPYQYGCDGTDASYELQAPGSDRPPANVTYFDSRSLPANGHLRQWRRA